LGSLGHGFPIGCGIALANKFSGNETKSYVLMSDGETNEGTTWEAAHFAVSHRLDNLIVIIDRNRIQGFGLTENILGDTSSPDKWRSMGFETHETDGHVLEEIIDALTLCKSNKNNRPKVIVANTVKGKGVSYMENRMEWHYLPMDDELRLTALKDIEKYPDA